MIHEEKSEIHLSLSSRANGYLVCIYVFSSLHELPIFLREYFSSFYKFFSNAVCVCYSREDRSSFLTDASFTAILQAMQTS